MGTWWWFGEYEGTFESRQDWRHALIVERVDAVARSISPHVVGRRTTISIVSNARSRSILLHIPIYSSRTATRTLGTRQQSNGQHIVFRLDCAVDERTFWTTER